MPSMKIPEKIWAVAEEAAVDATIIRRSPVQTTEVIRYALEKYLNDGVKDFLDEEKKQKKNS